MKNSLLILILISDMSNRWLSIRVEFLGNFIVFFAAVFAFYLRHAVIHPYCILQVNIVNIIHVQGHSHKFILLRIYPYIIRIYRDTLSAGVIALSISYAMQMIDGFGWTIRSLSFSNAIIIVG